MLQAFWSCPLFYKPESFEGCLRLPRFWLGEIVSGREKGFSPRIFLYFSNGARPTLRLGPILFSPSSFSNPPRSSFLVPRPPDVLLSLFVHSRPVNEPENFPVSHIWRPNVNICSGEKDKDEDGRGGASTIVK